MVVEIKNLPIKPVGCIHSYSIKVKKFFLFLIPLFMLLPDLSLADGLFDFQMKLASRGNAEAQFKVGEMYETGFGVKQNSDEAFKWISKAANKGHETAGFKLLYWDMEKNGINDSNKEKFAALKSEAEAGNPQAEYYIGKMYARGIGVKKDSDKAIEWLNKAVLVGVFAAEGELLLTRENKQREALAKRRQDEQKRAQMKAKQEADKQKQLQAKREMELKKKQDTEALQKQLQEEEAAAAAAAAAILLEKQKAAEAAAEKSRLQAERAAAELAEKKRKEEQKRALLNKLEAEKRTRKTQFESDPCSGKSARFLSTCR